MAPYINQEYAQPIARMVLDVADQIILVEYTEAWTEEWQEMLSERSTEKFMTHQDTEDREVSTEFDTVRQN